MNIDQIDLGQRDGFDVRAYITPDDLDAPDGDCYTAEDHAAFNRGDWSYVVIVVEASASGVVLGSAVLGAVEYGPLPGVEYTADMPGPYDYWRQALTWHDMVTEAVEDARAHLARINAQVTAKESA